jgi:hypothetical protein
MLEGKFSCFFLIIFIFIFSFLEFDYCIIINPYVVPELSSSPILSYRDLEQIVDFELFTIFSNDSNVSKKEKINNYKKNLFEIDGPLQFYYLDNAILNSFSDESNGSSALPSEWRAARYPIYMGLGGFYQGIGISFNLAKEIVPDRIVFGWRSGFCGIQSSLKLESKISSNDIQMQEEIFYESFRVYREMTSKIGINRGFSNNFSILDQDFYLKYRFYVDFLTHCRRIMFDAIVGFIAPSSPVQDISNPASIIAGNNGFWTIYGGGTLDFLLKEDINFGMVARFYYEVPKFKKIRLIESFEPILFGASTAITKVFPGLTFEFSPYLSLEGIRNGLGLRIAYSTVNHSLDKLKQIEMSDQKRIMEDLSSWNQEHVSFQIFYDFMRAKEQHDFEPFIGINAVIPVNFFFAKNSARSYAISMIFEVLY